MNAEGYIKLHRQITDNELWNSEKFTKAQAWIDLLLLATYKVRTVFIRGIEIHLKPGELCYSQLTLAKRWKWNRKTVDQFLKMLKNREMLDNRISRVTTIISIKKWGEYQLDIQQNGQQKDNKTDTNNKVKKVKNIYAIENIPIGLNGELFLQTKYFYITNSLKSELKEKLLLKLSDEEIKIQFSKMEVWLDSNKPKKNYKQFFMNWFDKEQYRKEQVKVFNQAEGSPVPAAHQYLT
jgi:DNA-binding transcriptional MocR family regulator